LNGVEIGRPGFNVGTVVTHALDGNRAATDVTTSGWDVFTNLPPTALVQGTNILAVELHQTGATSSDVAFAHNLIALVPTPVTFTLQPTNRTVSENRVVNLVVTTSGFPPPTFQWYKDTNAPVAIPDATNATYTIANTAIADTGDYFVIAMNALNSATSQVARLSVVNDTNGPVLLKIAADETYQRIILTWDELVAQGPAIEGGSYFVQDPAGNQVDVTSVDYNGSSVVLHVATMEKATNYTIEIDYQQDLVGNLTLPVGNPQLDPANGIATNFTTFVISFGLTRFDAYLNLPAGELIGQFVAMPIYPNGPTFSFYTNIVNWPQSVPGLEQYVMRFTGLFVASESGTHTFDMLHDDDARLRIYTSEDPLGTFFPELIETGVSPFGAGMTVAADFVAGQMYFYEMIVREFGGGDYAGLGVTLPSTTVVAPITSQYLAVPADAASAPNFNISTQATNQTIVENHSGTFSVTVTNTGGGVAYQWQRQPSGGGGFVDIAGAINSTYTTPYLTLANGGDQYRVVITAPGRTIVSGSATASVIPDTVRPILTGVNGTRLLNAIRVTFDEAVSSGTALNVANYTLTDTNGLNPLALSGPTLSADLRTVTFTTSAQTAGSFYRLRVVNVADVAGNTIVTTNFTFQVWVFSPGFVLKELYLDLGGGTGIGDLTNATKYPNSPDIVRYGPLAELNEGDEFDNYGARLSAVIFPPVSGNYTFFLATDDPGELWLSTDSTPANRVLVAREAVWANRREWTGAGGGGGRAGVASPSGGTNVNITGPIALVAGQSYYIESIMKEGGGGDNNGFTWQIPGGPAPVNTTTRGIGGYNLIGALADPVGASITIAQQPSSLNATQGQIGSFTVNASAVNANISGTVPLIYQWQRQPSGGGGFTDIAGATASNYVTSALTPADSGAQYRVLVFSPGASAISAAATVTIGAAAPTLRASVGVGGAINFSWDAPARLQFTMSLTAPVVWQDINTGGATTYTVTPSNEFNVRLSADQEPAPIGTGSGLGTVTLSNNVLVVDVFYGGMSGNRNNSHFHAPAPRGVGAGVAYNTAALDSATGQGTNGGTIRGTIPLANSQYGGKTIAAQIDDIRNQLWYLNVHSTTFAGGEIRGQVEPGARFYRLISP
jgi:hypothetical protein